MTPDTGRGPVSRPALSRLVAVSPESFASDYWARGPLLTRAGALPRGFADLFSAADVDEIVAHRAIRTPFVRMATEGVVLAPSRYTAPGGFGAEVGDQLSSDRVLDEFANGATLVLQGLHRTWQPIADFTRQLVLDVGHPSQVNAYVTPASSRGFDPHYDVHDVFVLQIHGEKHWTIHEPVHADPLADQPWTDHRDAVAARAAEPPYLDETFRPGDVLYLPRGWIHSATALGDTSIHLTIGVAALTRIDVVDRLVRLARDDATLREALPLGFDSESDGDSDALREIIESTVQTLVERLTAEEGSSDVVAAQLRQRVRSLSRPEPVRPLATVDALGALQPSTVVGWRHGLDARIETAGEPTAQSVRIVLPTKTVTLPGEAAGALRQLAAGAAVEASLLAGLDAGSSLVVARRLLREGILVVR